MSTIKDRAREFVESKGYPFNKETLTLLLAEFAERERGKWISEAERAPTRADGYQVIWRSRGGSIRLGMTNKADIPPYLHDDFIYWIPNPPTP